MKRYAVKSIFGPTIQGEGSLAGRVTAFVRFAGCNMWDGRFETKAASACPFCDTDFVGAQRMTAIGIVHAVDALLPAGGLVTLSGGEPMLQVDVDLVDRLAMRWRVAIETNGTREIESEIARRAHVTCSPKRPRSDLVLEKCDDLKLLYPHPDARMAPETWQGFDASSFFLQPINARDALDFDAVAATTRKFYDLAASGAPNWRMSLQLHKVIGVP